MKKLFAIIILAIVFISSIFYWPKLKSFIARQPQLAKLVVNNPAVENLKQQVLNGGALRGSEDSPEAYLTRVGTIKFTNQARQDNGSLPALTENKQLDLDAQNKLRDMFARQYFEHVAPDGKGPADQAKAAGYEYVLIGENLALGNFKNDQTLVDAWMHSPGHRANILNAKYQEIGVAVGQGIFEGRKVWLAVQEFGKPLSACPAVDASLKGRLDSLNQDVDVLLPQLKNLKQEIENSPEPKNQEQLAAYNNLVAQYNTLVNLYNNKVDQLKATTSQYNNQVQLFNECAS
jgi:hypothetical protein